MARLPFALALVAVATLLGACQPEEEEDLDPMLQGCLPVEGTVSVTNPGAECAGCLIDNLANAADGNPASFATISMPANQGGTATIRVTRTAGLDYALPRLYGVLQSISYGRSASPAITLRTFVDNGATPVDEEVLNLGSSVQGDQDSPARFAFDATGAFDVVELSFARTDGTTSPGVVTARIHEFCSNAP